MVIKLIEEFLLQNFNLENFLAENFRTLELIFSLNWYLQLNFGELLSLAWIIICLEFVKQFGNKFSFVGQKSRKLLDKYLFVGKVIIFVNF